MWAELSPLTDVKHDILISSHYYDVANWISRRNIIKFCTK